MEPFKARFFLGHPINRTNTQRRSISDNLTIPNSRFCNAKKNRTKVSKFFARDQICDFSRLQRFSKLGNRTLKGRRSSCCGSFAPPSDGGATRHQRSLRNGTPESLLRIINTHTITMAEVCQLWRFFGRKILKSYVCL